MCVNFELMAFIGFLFPSSVIGIGKRERKKNKTSPFVLALSIGVS